MIGLARGLSHRGGNNPPVHTAPRDPPPVNVSNHNPTKRFGRRRAAACTGLAVVTAGLLLACLVLFHYFRSSADTEVLNVTQLRSSSVPSVVSSTTSAPQIAGEEPSAKPNEGGIGSFFSPNAILGKLAEYHNVLQDGKARSDFEEKRAQLEAMLKDPLGHVRQRLEERKGLGMPHGRDDRVGDNDGGVGTSKDEHKKEMRRRMLENLERMSRDLKEKRQALVAHPDGTPFTDEESHRLRELKENQLKVDQMLERIRQQQREEAERDERQRRTSYFSEDQMKRLQQVSSEEGKGRHLEDDHRAHNAVLRTDGIAKEVERHRAAFDAFSEAQQREHLADALRAAEQHRASNNNRDLPPRHGDTNSLLGQDSDPEGKQVGVPNAGAIDAAELRDQQAHTLMGDALAARVRHDAIPMDFTGRRSYEKQDSVQSVHGRRTNEGKGVAAGEDPDAASHHSPPTGLPSPRIRLALFSTLKPCEGNDEARYAQLDAVMSWALLPLNPHIYLLGRDSCHAWVAAKVNRYLMDTHHKQQQQEEPQHNWKSVVQVVPDAPSGPSGTILLGPAIALLASREPDADLYGFLNADILLHPVMVPTAVEVAMQSLREFFLIGRRLGVTIPKTARASFHQQEDHDEAGATSAEGGSLFSVTGAQWYEQNRFLSQSRQDRIDAEDYFFWTNNFFRTSELVIPPFHIGRPAYDNWLVHHAIHTWKPVLDASELFLAYHQTHGYQHLEPNKNDEEDDNKDPQTDKKGKKSAAYWGKQEQQENYDLGITHGGWQHGLIEFSPLQFLPEGCGAALAANKQMKHQGGGEERHAKSSLECEIGMGDHWKPFGDDAPFRTKEDARLHYARFSRRP